MGNTFYIKNAYKNVPYVRDFIEEKSSKPSRQKRLKNRKIRQARKHQRGK